ncbi:MAG: hypothetical protein R2749_01530 [Acidimicrobiales bacterium]
MTERGDVVLRALEVIEGLRTRLLEMIDRDEVALEAALNLARAERERPSIVLLGDLLLLVHADRSTVKPADVAQAAYSECRQSINDLLEYLTTELGDANDVTDEVCRFIDTHAAEDPASEDGARASMLLLAFCAFL